MKIKIFLDGADRASMIEYAGNPLVQGFTTNPSLMRKAGVSDIKAYAQEMIPKLNGKPVSFEVFADDFVEMKRQALEIARWGATVYVKVPITNSQGESCIPLVRELSHEGVKLNVTALYTLDQVWATCEAVRGGAGALVSVFAGRIADTGRDPMPIMIASAAMCEQANAGAPKGSGDKQVELLWASTREAFNVLQAEAAGCQIITAPADVIKKVAAFGKDLKSVSLDTVKTFKTDSDAAGFTL